MKAFYGQDFSLGILGGGQLGRMLLQPCAAFDVFTRILDPDPAAPCSRLAGDFHEGSLLDHDTVLAFGRQCDLITIEIENVNVEALTALEASGIPVYPQPHVIGIIQDKRLQKQFYTEHGIPTAPFRLVDDAAAVAQHGDFLPAFHKLGRGGYDGGGVQRLNDSQDLGRAFDAPGLLEQAIDFAAELSVIVARNGAGEVRSFPPVECVFHPEYNLVDHLLAPSTQPQAVLAEAEAVARQVAEALGIIGLLAVELFVTREGRVLVNEVAPRPHNSGHQTIEANATSQYAQHLRAILGLPLGDTRMLSPSAMVNLLGEDGHTGDVLYEGLDDVLAIEGVSLCLYGKKQTRPRRKMGHITIIDPDHDRLLEKVSSVRAGVRVIAA